PRRGQQSSQASTGWRKEIARAPGSPFDSQRKTGIRLTPAAHLRHERVNDSTEHEGGARARPGAVRCALNWRYRVGSSYRPNSLPTGSVNAANAPMFGAMSVRG